jgi:hypothetical protein
MKKKAKKEKEILENSYRVIWEVDVDAADAISAARLAYDSILNGVVPIFTVHKWIEPDMKQVEPLATIDLNHPDAELPVPKPIVILENYMGPDIV